MPRELPKEQRNKEERLLSLVQERLEAGEKVLIYYSFINKTDTGNSLLNMLEENGITAFEMKSNIAPDKREEWVEKHLEKGMEVMICNPSLVETGLDLLEFTSIIFYQMGYNLFTMRQASRRSWRLSQSKDVKVYFMYYQNSIQEQAISLMATKLQAAMAIEGKFSEEGLRAMSNNEDLLTQIANNVVEGIKDTVNEDIFKATAFIKSTESRNRPHPILPSRLKLRFNSFGNKTIFSNPETEKIPARKVIEINEELLNNPIALFI
jgi:superfamily II DNA/RNA helicase